MIRIPKPAAGEHDPYYAKYIALVGDDALAALRSGSASTPRLLSGVTETQALHRYAPGKWSVKEVVGHIVDSERVFAYRALRVARGDRTPLAGYDEQLWVPEGRFDARPLPGLVAEYSAVRAATLALFGGLDPEVLGRIGNANGSDVSVRALAHIMAGHEQHHVKLLRERYKLA
jgi:hypothetical protein